MVSKRRITHGVIRGVAAPEVQCGGKEAFANGALAHRAAVRVLSKKRGGLAVYRCPHCGKFHIGRS